MTGGFRNGCNTRATWYSTCREGHLENVTFQLSPSDHFIRVLLLLFFCFTFETKRVWPRQTVKRNCVPVRTKTRKKKHFDISGRGKVTMEFGIDCVVEKSNKSPKGHQRHLTVTLYTLSWCRRQIRQMIKIEATKCFFFRCLNFASLLLLTWWARANSKNRGRLKASERHSR